MIAAFENAGHPLTLAAPGWVSPGDLLHMREGDIATLAPSKALVYVGHIKPGIYLRSRALAKNQPIATDLPSSTDQISSPLIK
ncbi:hypothetical protein D3C81_2015440 [compost metagenome]